MLRNIIIIHHLEIYHLLLVAKLKEECAKSEELETKHISFWIDFSVDNSPFIKAILGQANIN